MPLFFLLSGYVTRYSEVICSGKMLGHFVLKRTLAYLAPWLVWTFLVRGIVFGETAFLDMKYLLWHMDSGYWFLTSLWLIVLAFGVSQFVASKIVQIEKPVKYLAATLVCFAVCAVILFAAGLVVGLSFLGIKLTVYYMPFYALGVLYGKLQKCSLKKIAARITDVIVLVSCVVYFALIVRFDLFSMGESILEIGIRVLGSLTGCVALCGLLGKAVAQCKKMWGLNWVGTHSLELYLVHNLLLCTAKPMEKPLASSLEGIGLCALNYLITVVLSVLFVWMLHQNRLLRKVLFWK